MTLSAVERRSSPLYPIEEQIGFPGRQVHLADETLGPGASHKDRPVAAMLAAKLESGELIRGGEVVDYTTGSAGCSVAALTKLIGVRATLFIPDNTTPERIAFMQAHGAKVILTPPDQVIGEGSSLSSHQVWIAGAVGQARTYVEATRGSVLLNQSSNPNNAAAFHALGAHILGTFSHADRPTHVVAASGTGATIIGLGQAVRPWGVKTVAAEPYKSASTWAEKHRREFVHSPHDLLGTGAGAASPIVQSGIAEVDEVIRVDDKQAYEVCRDLQGKGLDFGATTGANVIAARHVLARDPRARVVVIAHDEGKRYRSRGL